MIGRSILGLRHAVPKVLASRGLHKGIESAPPMRYISMTEHVGTYLFISITLLSYPTFVLLRLNDLRPQPHSELSPETQQALEEHRAARLARSH